MRITLLRWCGIVGLLSMTVPTFRERSYGELGRFFSLRLCWISAGGGRSYRWVRLSFLKFDYSPSFRVNFWVRGQWCGRAVLSGVRCFRWSCSFWRIICGFLGTGCCWCCCTTAISGALKGLKMNCGVVGAAGEWSFLWEFRPFRGSLAIRGCLTNFIAIFLYWFAKKLWILLRLMIFWLNIASNNWKLCRYCYLFSYLRVYLKE